MEGSIVSQAPGGNPCLAIIDRSGNYSVCIRIIFPRVTSESSPEMKNELEFEITTEGDLLVAVCENPDLATHAHSLEELLKMVRDLILCHFDDGDQRRNATAVFHFHEEEKVRAYA